MKRRDARKAAEDASEDACGDDAGSGGEQRLDRWLWHARFYKTRSLAAGAVENGRVAVNGARAKPARAVHRGDVIVLAQGGRDVEVEVLALPVRRGPAPEARSCYRESASSVARGIEWQIQHRLAALAVPRSDGRPDKKARRELIDLARRQGRS
jgi:ribosome-associated heat shock protein Hsp15